MINKDKFVIELNDIKKSIYGVDCHDITKKQLDYFAFSKNIPNKYIEFDIPKKKTGEFRRIIAPCKNLKFIQRCINALLQKKFTPHSAAYGFVPGKSIVDNAAIHVGQRYIYNIDLENFFPSVNLSRVQECLMVPPFSYDKKTSYMIARLCCNDEHRLPQGAPTSPTMTNIVCKRLDRRLIGLAKKFNMRYSRYADDITFSCIKNFFHEDSVFISLLHDIIKDEGFDINNGKTRLNNMFQRQEITGLIVNEKTNVRQKYVKKIRTIINNWEKGGYDYAQAIFIKHCNNGKIHMIENVIKGMLDYLKMVKGYDDSTYNRLNERFVKLITANKQQVQTFVIL